MTVVEVLGSTDAEHWQPYVFKYAPTDVNRRPALFAPHQPRLDQQLAMVGTGDLADNLWLVHLVDKLLEVNQVLPWTLCLARETVQCSFLQSLPRLLVDAAGAL